MASFIVLFINVSVDLYDIEVGLVFINMALVYNFRSGGDMAEMARVFSF